MSEGQVPPVGVPPMLQKMNSVIEKNASAFLEGRAFFFKFWNFSCSEQENHKSAKQEIK